LEVVLFAPVKKATPKTSCPESAKSLQAAQVTLSVDPAKSAEREPLVLEPALMSATLLSAQQTQSVLLTITKDSASVMLDFPDLQTAELVVYHPLRVVQMMLNVKKMKFAE